ncbi:Imm52 family immunity protein [Kribbella sp. NPDC056345]|uniref:Imm52 family immunity protein n=1 Tax=Kribbella sp. NPDC056345 TaxID=3345789 RepID=UPI0035DE0EF0
MNDLIARGFWGPRQESPEVIADKLVALLADLDKVVGESLPWSSHHLPGKLLAEPVNALQVISDAFRDNTDAPQLGINQVYEARGARVGELRISMSVGGYSDSPKLHNTFLVRWSGAELGALAGPVLRRLVAAWDPDWAAVTSRSLMNAMAEVQPRGTPGPKVGYLTYLSEGRAQVLPGGLGKHLRELENGGVVIGSGEDDGFLSEDEVGAFARDLKSSAAFAAIPTSRSKF